MGSLTPYYYAVHYQAQPPLIRGLALRPLSATEFTETCEMLLALAEAHRCRYWLLDGRTDENTRPPDIYDWLVEDFLPRVRQALGRAPCLAFVARPGAWDEVRARGHASAVPVLARAAWFTNEPEALAWMDLLRPASSGPNQ